MPPAGDCRSICSMRNGIDKNQEKKWRREARERSTVSILQASGSRIDIIVVPFTTVVHLKSTSSNQYLEG